MGGYYEAYEAQRNAWKSTKLGRLNHGYNVLCAKRSRLDDDDPKKHGSFLAALKVFERKIKDENEIQEVIRKGYYLASQLGEAELEDIYSRSTSQNHQCEAGQECFTCLCGKVLADRAAGKEQAFPFKE